jgi:hypothetical protein
MGKNNLDASLSRLLGQIFKPAKPDYQVEWEKAEKSCYGKAKRLAKKLNIEIQLDHVYSNDFPPEVQKGYWLAFDDDVPTPDCVDGDTFSTSWNEVLSKLLDIEREWNK